MTSTGSCAGIALRPPPLRLESVRAGSDSAVGAAGGWLAGAIYDFAGFYGAAFVTGIAFNFVHIVIIGTLVLRRRRLSLPSLAVASPGGS